MWVWMKKMLGWSKSTRITGLQVVEVVDGDTLKVDIQGKTETLRLQGVDTEESQGNSGKPITHAGKLASEMAKHYFSVANGFCKVDLEFDVSDSAEECLKKQRDTFGRLLCYVHKQDENYNQKCIAEGWSPYFDKYGRSRLYHDTFVKAQQQAQKAKFVIWDPKTNEGGPKRDYDELLPWWKLRGDVVENFRKNRQPQGVLSLEEDYDKVVKLANSGKKAIVFCDLKEGITGFAGNGAFVRLSRKNQPFSLWIPNTSQEHPNEVCQKIENEFAGHKQGYAEILGQITTYKEHLQIEILSVDQISK